MFKTSLSKSKAEFSACLLQDEKFHREKTICAAVDVTTKRHLSCFFFGWDQLAICLDVVNRNKLSIRRANRRKKVKALKTIQKGCNQQRTTNNFSESTGNSNKETIFYGAEQSREKYKLWKAQIKNMCNGFFRCYNPLRLPKM